MRDGAFAALPLIVTVVGVLLYLLGVYLIKEAPWQAILFSVASAILAGGVFAGLLKSFQFIGVFRDAIADVMYRDSKFLERLDLPALMLSVISASIAQRFPDLSRKMSKAVFDSYLTFAKDYYYTDMHRRITILSYEDKTDIVTFQEEFRLSIHASPGQEIDYSFKLYGPHLGSPSEIPCKVTGLGVDNQSYMDAVHAEAKDGNYFLGYELKLSGRPTYNVTRTMDRRHVLAIDPFVKAVSTRFLDGAELVVENRVPSKIGHHLIAIGLKEEAIVPDAAMVGDTKRWSIEGLIFPRQGYILLLSKKP